MSAIIYYQNPCKLPVTLTPERFWDPDIIEDSADDPRNKIFHASPLRKRREEKAFEVGEVVNGDEFE